MEIQNGVQKEIFIYVLMLISSTLFLEQRRIKMDYYAFIEYKVKKD